jgi:phage shock protein PspC (stress-responsive transcriptional regulator)
MSYGSMTTRRPRWVCGVCADIADRAAVPAWMPRAAFILLGLVHFVAALILYFFLAYVLSPRRSGAARFAPPRQAADDFSGVRARFRGLDERLSNLEAATLRSEAELRRAFRDLERR